MKLTTAKDFSSVHFTPCQRNLSEKLEDYASYLLIGEEETFDSNWIVEDNERGFHISLHYKGDRLNKHRVKRKEEVLRKLMEKPLEVCFTFGNQYHCNQCKKFKTRQFCWTEISPTNTFGMNSELVFLHHIGVESG